MCRRIGTRIESLTRVGEAAGAVLQHFTSCSTCSTIQCTLKAWHGAAALGAPAGPASTSHRFDMSLCRAMPCHECTMKFTTIVRCQLLEVPAWQLPGGNWLV